MEDRTWSPVPSTASRGYPSKIKSHFELFIDFEEVDGDDELKTAYSCPFCGEDFDLLELCCHLEEDHPVEAKTEICPLCLTWVGTNLVEHISAHRSILESQIKPGYPKFEPYGALSLSRKDLLDGDGCWPSFSTGSSSEISTSKTACDQLLSFLHCPAAPDERENLQPASSSEVSIEKVDSKESVLARNGQQSFSDEDEIWKAQRGAFVQELLISTILDPDF
ncbi:protein DEHYDRATION-INDUCED 19 homolog 3 [Neltuma alba]|uniref:protein DEHYDRATION-INDUCED 19 homolog 3 n=1 Tax=Neltuma alba TaxID=207710 RepID=UPI0010A35360|nr:protein DEHYDRATION-INDUCED 19 homolog 3-like [Prosopis alba]